MITFKPSKAALDMLSEAGVDFTYFDGHNPPREWLERNLRDALVVVVPPWQFFNAELMNLSPDLKLLFVHGSGLDKVDVDEACRRGVYVANAPDAIAQAVAEHALALTLAMLRNVVAGDRVVRAGMWTSDVQRALTGRSLRGKRVGVIGLGRVGSEVAKLFRCLGVEVVYWSRSRKAEVEHALDLKYLSLEELLRTSDVIVVSIALTSNTRNLLSHRELSMLKPGAVLINVSRGAIVDEEALVKALSEGRIYAGLDVYAAEPLRSDSELLRLENTVLTPHIAGFTYEALGGTSEFVARSVISFVNDGKPPYTTVNASRCVQTS